MFVDSVDIFIASGKGGWGCELPQGKVCDSRGT